MPLATEGLIPLIHNAFIGALSFLNRLALLAADDMPVKPAADIVEKTARTASAVFTIVIVAIGILGVLLLALKIRNELAHSGAGGGTDHLGKALKAEKKGNHAEAAAYYEAHGDMEKAAANFEHARDYSKAGAMYEQLGRMEKAVACYKRSGESLKAAVAYMKAKNYIEAAKIFKNKGDTLRAAQAFELMGSKVAAAREYRLAGQHLKAAKLYKEEEMYAEAGEAFYTTIAEVDMAPDNLAKFYTYAAFLVMAGDFDKASDIYTGILSVDPDFRDVRRKLKLIGFQGELPPSAEPEEEAPLPERIDEAAEPAASVEAESVSAGFGKEPAPAQAVPIAPEPLAVSEADEMANRRMMQDEIDDLFDQVSAEEISALYSEEEPTRMESTLRTLMAAGRMEPKYCLRIWMQILRKLYDKHSSGVYYGCLPPESIHIDMENNIRLDAPGRSAIEYIAPEVVDGAKPDERSDIYSMGVILFELLSGTLDGMPDKHPMDHNPDVPEWLDMLVMKCIIRNPLARFENIDEVSSTIMMKAASGD